MRFNFVLFLLLFYYYYDDDDCYGYYDQPNYHYYSFDIDNLPVEHHGVADE